jgi:hypothetical protein
MFVTGRSSSQYVECESTIDTAITSSSTCDSYGLHLHSILSGSTGLTPGTSIAFNNSLTDNVPLGNIALDKIGASHGEIVIGTRNGSTCDTRLRIGSTNITFNGASLLTTASGDARYLMLTGGKLTGNLGIGNALPTTLTYDFTIMENGSDPSIFLGRLTSANNGFLLRYRHNTDGNTLNRIVIDNSNGTEIVSITANGRLGLGSPTPTQRLEVAGNVNVSNGNGYMIGGTSIDTRYLRTDVDTTSTAVVRFYASQAAGAADQTIVRLGHTVSSGDWFFRHHRSSGGAENNCLELLNTNSSLLGMSIGTFNGTSVGDGCMMVMNGIQGDGTFIKASSVNCSGGLHLNCGIPQAVPSGWGYNPTGSGSIPGGTVSISLYTYNNIWVRGSVYCTSDARLKDVVSPIDADKAMNLLNVNPVWYSWKSDKSKTLQLGLLAQDLVKNDLKELTCLFDNADLSADTEHDIPEKKQLVIAYDKIPLYNLEIIKNLHARVLQLEELVEKLTSKPALQKWISKK